MKKLFLASLLALAFSTAGAAGVELDTPFIPDDDIKAAVSTSGGWVEVYKLELEKPTNPKDPVEKKAVEDRNKEKVEAALKQLAEKKKPEGLVSVGVDGYIFFSQEKAQSQLKEVELTIKRKGEVVDYDDQCKVVPKPGDVLETTYRSDDGVDEAIVRSVVREHQAFGFVGKSSTTPEKLSLRIKEHCAAVIDSRIYAVGTMTFKHKNKVTFRQNVLVQYVAQP